MVKKLFTLLLLTLLPSWLCAQVEIDGLFYNLYSDGNTPTAEVTSYSYINSGRIVIPASVNYEGITYDVTSIGGSAFNCCYELQSVVISEGIRSIGPSAFLFCDNLSMIELPSTITSIDEGAFVHSPYTTSAPHIISHITEPFAISNNVFGTSENWYSENTDPSPKILFVPVGTKSKYEALSGWTKFAKIEEGELKETTINGLHYECYTISKTATVVRDDSYQENLTSIEIPATITVEGAQYSVTAIGFRAFENCWQVNSVTIPNSVTSIGNSAFQGCSGFTSLAISSNVASIGEYAFHGCWNLTSIVVENGNQAYDSRGNCNALIETATNTLLLGCNNSVIPSSVTAIGAYAFMECNQMTSLTIPSGVTSIGEYAFQNCNGLTSIVVENGNQTYDSRDNCNALIETATNTLILGCQNTVIPNSVITIGERAFENLHLLQTIIIPEGVKSIGERAFLRCMSLSKVVLPSTLTSIGKGAFISSPYATSVPTIISHITEPFAISDDVFGITDSWPSENPDPSSATLYVPEGTTSSYEALSGWNKFAKIEEGELLDVTIDGLHYEYNSGTKTATIVRDDSYPNNLTSVEIPASIAVDGVQYDVTAIGERTFGDCWNLTSVTIPNSVTIIGKEAFRSCGLQSVTIPEGVTSIGEGAFQWSERLSKVELPSTLTSIGEGAFTYSPYSSFVPNIISHIAEPFAISDKVFGILDDWDAPTNPSSATLYVPVGSKSKYEALSGWNKFAKIEEGELLDATIDGLHYEYNSGTKTATIVRDDSYQNNLTSVEIPASITVGGVQCNVKGIGDRAFEGCWQITSITIPNSVTSIGEYAFLNCNNLTSIVVEDGNSKYDSRDNCNALIETATNTLIVGCNNTVIPNSVTSIGNHAFENCHGLPSVIIPEGVTSIGECAFIHCGNLSKVVLPSTLTSIGEAAFASSPYASVPNIISHIAEPFAISDKVFGILANNWDVPTNPSSATLYVPVGSKSKYEALSGWNKFAKIEEGELLDATIDGLHYEYNSGTKTATIVRDDSYQNNLTSVEIPATIAVGEVQCDVTAIGDRAFEYCWQIASITIPNSVTSIGKSAFQGCGACTSITIPNSVTSIGDLAFNNCSSLQSVIIPEGVTSIGEGAFQWCYNLSKVELPSTLTSIGEGAFVSSSNSVSVPNIISHITEPFAISNNVFGTSENWYSENTDPSSKTLFVPVGTKSKYEVLSGWNKFAKIEEGELSETTINGLHYEYNSGSKTATIVRDDSYRSMERIEIPATITVDGVQCNVTAIGDMAFDNCWKATSITIPNGVTSIGNYAFQGCSGFTTLTISSNVTSIGEYAFRGCWGLTSIVVEDGNQIYDSRNNCNALIETATNTLLTGCNNTVIPSSVTTIGAYAFQGCYQLKSLTIPSGLISIGEYALQNCNGLTSIVVENGNQNYDSRDNCNALIETATNTLILGCQNTVIPNSVKAIGDNAFENCDGLQSVIIPEGVTSIGRSAFMWCYNLSKVELPSTLTSIGEGAFVSSPYANNTPHIISHITEPFAISNNVFGVTDTWYSEYTNPSPKTLYVPEGTTSSYEALSGWNKFAKMVEGEMPETTIDGYTLIAEKDWMGVSADRLYYIQFPDPANGSVTGGTDGIEITVTKDVGQLWQPQAIVLQGLNLEEDSDYKVVITAKLPCNGQLQINLGNWEKNFQYANSITATGDFQQIVFDFPEYGSDVTDAHVRFMCGNFVGTTIVQKVQVFRKNDGNPDDTSFTKKGITYEITGTGTVKVSSVDKTLTRASIPKSVSYYGNSYSVTAIGEDAFKDCISLTSLDISTSVTTIGNFAFEGCVGLSSVSIPNSVISIGKKAFLGCSGLTSVQIGEKVTSIEASVFSGCSNLKTIISLVSSPFDIEINTFDESIYNTAELVIPKGTLSDYQSKTGWSSFNKISEVTDITPVGYTLIAKADFTTATEFTGWYQFSDEQTDGKVELTADGLAISFGSATGQLWQPQIMVLGDGSFDLEEDANYKVIITAKFPTDGTLQINMGSWGSNDQAIFDVSSTGDFQVLECDFESWSVSAEDAHLIYQCGDFAGTTIIQKIQVYKKEGGGGPDATSFVIDDIRYKVNGSGTVMVKSADKSLTNVSIPETVTYYDNTYSVTAIGEGAFGGCQELTSITIPNTVTTIGKSAFNGCSGLTSVEIPNSVTSIDAMAFFFCSSLTEVTIPNSVTSIGDLAFTLCRGLSSVTIPNSVTSIGESAFSSCSGLTSVTIPSSVTYMGNGVFSGCSNLTTMKVESNNTVYDSRDNCNAIIETGNNILIAGCKSTIIPNTVTAIGERAFGDCSGLTSITIPNSVTYIGYSAFFGCSGLTSITIPNSVTFINDEAFGDCSGLATITVESGNPVYDSRNNCNAIIQTEYNTLVAGCKTTIIPNDVTSIGNSAFYGCSDLTSVTIPNSVTSIGWTAFAGCSGLTSVSIPNSVTSIGGAAFNSCSGLTSVTIPNGVTTIEGSVFEACSSLTSVTIPNSVTSIEGYAFRNCSNLTDFYSLAEDVPTTNTEVFSETNIGNITLHVPAGCVDTYLAVEPWNGFKEIVELVSGISLDKTELVIEKTKTATLTATISPTALDQSVTWKSSNTKVATVTSDGEVYGVKAGKATITCTSAVTGASATCEVTVGYVKLDQTELVVEKGKTATLKSAVYPSTLEDRSVTWTSSDTRIATVSSAGKVKGVKGGMATITCTSKATGLSASCQVIVGYVKLSQTELAIEKGKTATLKAAVYPSTLEDRSVTWTSSDTRIATVSSSGEVNGVKGGMVTITCTSNATGLSATCQVTVGYVKLSQTELVVEKGKTATLKSAVYPSTLEDKSVTWTSSNTAVATVSSSGKVKGIKGGMVTITCTSNATGLSATCQVIVGYVKLSQTELVVEKGQIVTLKAAVYPSTLEDRSVTWTSSDTKIVKVSSSGKLKGVKAGTATITCTSNATGLSTTCEVTVTATSNGRGDDDDVTDIESLDENPDAAEPFDVYDLRGQKVRHQVTSLEGLPTGIYIVNGKKILKKK